MPIVGSGTVRLQPVYIDDLVEVFKKIILNPAFYGKTLEVGGPEQLSFNEIMDDIKEALGSKKPTVHVPLCLVRPRCRGDGEAARRTLRLQTSSLTCFKRITSAIPARLKGWG